MEQKTWPLTRSWGARLPLCCSITLSAWISWSMGLSPMFPTAQVIRCTHGVESIKI
ncbi:TPA: hypothetical protein OUJ27_001004 [Klebsiella michiganensis]|nr:hypothetical protein [Klebsiella michiganensis]